MIRVSAALHRALANSAAARLPISVPICVPEKPTRATRSALSQSAGLGPLAHTWSSEVRRVTPAFFASATTCGPTADSGTTMMIPLFFCAMADLTSVIVFEASFPRLTTVSLTPSSSAFFLAPAASETKYS